MNLTSFLSHYLSWQILISAGFILAEGWGLFARIWRPSISQAAQLRVQYILLAGVLLFASGSALIPHHEIFRPILRIWSATPEPSRNASRDFAPRLVTAFAKSEISLPVGMDPLTQAFGFLMLFLIMAGASRLLLELYRLAAISRRAVTIRKFRSVRISVRAQLRVPISFWWPFRSHVILPQSLVGTDLFRIAILHELQHHRQGDTRWVYVQWALRGIFFPNPCIHLWNRRIAQLQEFACDETLVDQKKVDSLDYARGLLEAAQTAFSPEEHPAGAAGLGLWGDRHILKRRMTLMLENRKTKLGLPALKPLLIITLALLGAVAFASQGLVQDRRITRSEAEKLVRTDPTGESLPVVVNDEVVKWLNFYTGTSENRDKVRAGLARMQNYRSFVAKKLDEYRMPQEFLALPLLESGYQNLEPKRNPVGAAGLWQFIASTARNFDLKVDLTDARSDERLNVELETDAALRLLLSNKLRFKDWNLSILSYNAGEKTVQDAILKTGSRDAWVLAESGFSSEENSNYLPKLMAAILIIQNPKLVD